MRHNPDNRIAVKTHPAAPRGDAAAYPFTCPISPHVIDLKGTPSEKRAADERPTGAPRGFGKFRHLLDERIHLHDLRVRTLSVRPRGWKDFPPMQATTLWQAVRITVARFFNEHPLADLTILTVAHLTVVISWKLFVMPAEFALAFVRGSKREKAVLAVASAPAFLPLLPLAPVFPKASVGMSVATEPPEVFSAPEAEEWQPRWPAFAFELPAGWRRGVLGFAATALIFTLPFGAYSSLDGLKDEKDAVLGKSLRAVEFLRTAGSAAQARDFDAAGQAFSEAAKHFDGAKQELGALGNALTSAASLLPVNSPFSSASPLLNAGREIARGGEYLTAGMASLDAGHDPIEKMRALETAFSEALPHLEKANRSLSKISPRSMPEAYRAYIETAQEQTPMLTKSVGEAIAIASTLQEIMGKDGTRRYLVVFQNNAELRPTGGFIGSFALVDVDRGKVKKVEIPGGGSYDLKGSLMARVASPQPLHLINPHWQFQDANWSPDFPTSARKLVWFYERSGGPTTDGVIAINATFMEKLLDVVGPFDMPEYGKVITAENFFFETQKQVELDYDREENKPKQFLADLAPKVMERVLAADRQTFMRMTGILDDALSQKDLQFWFRDGDVQSKVSGFGWGGEMKSSEGDYLYLVHTNIAGQKTDLAMKDDVRHSVKILPDATAIVTLTLSRTHTGQKGALFDGVRNVDYLRAYVPRGSVLVEARGFEPPDPKLFKIADAGYEDDPTIGEQEEGSKIDKASGTRISAEGDRTVFGNWIQTDPGETSVITLVYQLPAGTVRLRDSADGALSSLYERITGKGGKRMEYALLVQKQAGANPASFASSVDLPRGFYPVWQSPARQEDERNRLTVNESLRQDSFFGLIAELH